MSRCLSCLLVFAALCATSSTGQDRAGPAPFRVGIIGLDTSHAPAFAKEINDAKAPDKLRGVRVVAAYPKGSPDIISSVERVPEYTEAVRKLGVEVVGSIEELVGRVDGVLLETNDGRPHLEQAIPVLRAGKPVFVDKPVAGSLADAVALYAAAKRYECPIFSSSALRFVSGAQALRAGSAGAVLGCDAFSPCHLEKTHPDLFWYGVHGCETLFTVMGPGCETASRTATADSDVVVGRWKDGRLGTFRGLRKGPGGFGGLAFTDKGTRDVGAFEGYGPLVTAIVHFFRTRQPPVSAEETLELYAFMEAADESKRRGGRPVALREVLDKATAAASVRLEQLGAK